MPLWLIYALLCLICFGLWGFFSRIALDTNSPWSTLVFQSVGITVVTVCLLKPALTKSAITGGGMIYATLTGVSFALGSVLFFLATKQHDRVSVVVTLTALYPLVTLLLAWIFLSEAMTLKQSVGIAMAIVAMLLMA